MELSLRFNGMCSGLITSASSHHTVLRVMHSCLISDLKTNFPMPLSVGELLHTNTLTINLCIQMFKQVIGLIPTTILNLITLDVLCVIFISGSVRDHIYIQSAFLLSPPHCIIDPFI